MAENFEPMRVYEKGFRLLHKKSPMATEQVLTQSLPGAHQHIESMLELSLEKKCIGPAKTLKTISVFCCFRGVAERHALRLTDHFGQTSNLDFLSSTFGSRGEKGRESGEGTKNRNC